MRLFSAPGSSEAEIVNLFEICHVRLHVFTLFRKFKAIPHKDKPDGYQASFVQNDGKRASRCGAKP